MVGLCGDLQGPVLHVLDPETLRPLATRRLPDRRILEFGTADASGRPALPLRRSFDVSTSVPSGDCLLAVLPDWDGRIWFVTQDGRVGTVEPTSGSVAVLPLGEEVDNSLAVDEDGVYVATLAGMVRVRDSPPG